MADIQELMHEAADPVVALPAHQLARTAVRRMRRRRLVHAGLAAVAVLAVVGLGVGGLSGTGRPVITPATVRSLPSVPVDRPVGAGKWVTTTCAEGTCQWMLTLRDDIRYRVPGALSYAARSNGVVLSPGGRWLAYNSHGGVTVRELTGTTTYQIDEVGNAGYPLAWSADNRWLVLATGTQTDVLDRAVGRSGGLVTGSPSDVLDRVDLRSGHIVPFREPQGVAEMTRSGPAVAGVLPSGNVLFPQLGHQPVQRPTRTSPSRVGPGSYQVVDPVTGTVMRQIRAAAVVGWQSQAPNGDPNALARHKKVHDEWSGWGAPVTTTPDGRRAAVVTTVHHGTRISVFDAATGRGRVIDLESAAGYSAPDGLLWWVPVSFTGHRLTLLAGDHSGDGDYLTRLVLDTASERVVSIRSLDCPDSSVPATQTARVTG